MRPLPLNATWLTPEPWKRWIEAALVTLLSLLLPWWLQPEDPFLANADFPWQGLGPLLVALRYGFGYGLASALTLSAVALFSVRSGWVEVGLSESRAFGLTLSALIAGEFRDLWERVNEHQRIILDHTRSRFDSFSKRYAVLSASHDRLERAMAGHALSLRQALLDSRRMLRGLSEARLETAAPAILELFAEYGGLLRAGLHGMGSDGRPLPTAAATLGDYRQQPGDDPLVRRMLESAGTVSLTDLSDSAGSRYQVCIPLVDPTGKWQGVILVETIQFFALTRENLELLAVIAEDLAESLSRGLSSPVLDGSRLEEFAAAVQRAARVARRYRVPSALTAMDAPTGSQAADYLKTLSGDRRSLDLFLSLNSAGGRQLLLVLMPVTDEMGLEGFQGRVRNGAHNRLGRSVEELDLRIIPGLVMPAEGKRLEEFIDACDFPADAGSRLRRRAA